MMVYFVLLYVGVLLSNTVIRSTKELERVLLVHQLQVPETAPRARRGDRETKHAEKRRHAETGCSFGIYLLPTVRKRRTLT